MHGFAAGSRTRESEVNYTLSLKPRPEKNPNLTIADKSSILLDDAESLRSEFGVTQKRHQKISAYFDGVTGDITPR